MKIVNYGLPNDKHLTIRVNAQQLDHIVLLASENDVSPSQYIRSLIDMDILRSGGAIDGNTTAIIYH